MRKVAGVMRYLLLGTFVGLMADIMFGWQLAVLPGVSLKNLLLYVILSGIGISAAVNSRKLVIDLPYIHLFFWLLLVIAFLSWAANTLIGMYVDYAPFSGLVAWKGYLLDHYLFFLLFFVGVTTQRDVIWLQKWILFFLVLANVATVMDAYDIPDMGFIDKRGDGRVKGPLGQPNDYGIFLAVFLPILVAKAFTEAGAWRVYFSVGAAATFWALLLTVSRGSFVALTVGTLFSVYFLRQYLNAMYVRRFLMVVIVALIGAAFVIGDEYINLILERTIVTADTGDAYTMTSGRVWIWSNALRIMASEPWSVITGYGWDTTQKVLGITMHSRYLNYLFELGIFGLLSFIALLFSVLYSARRAIALGQKGNELMPGMIGFVFGFATLSAGLVGGNVYSPWYFVWAYTGLAMRGAVVLMLHSPTRPAPAMSEPPISVRGADGPSESRA